MAIITKAVPTENPSGSLIGYETVIASGIDDISGSSGIENTLTKSTYDRLVLTTTALDLIYSLNVAQEIDYIAIGAHNLAGQTFQIFYTPIISGSTFTLIATVTPTDNSAILIRFDRRTVGDFKITGTMTQSAIEIGVVFAGNILEMPRNIYGGHSPITLSQKTEYQSVMSESGQFLSKNIIRKGIETAYSWRLLDDQFYRDSFQPFVEHARTSPFFLKWRPDFYPDEVAYGQVEQDIQPSNSGGGTRHMTVGFTMKGHADK